MSQMAMTEVGASLRAVVEMAGAVASWEAAAGHPRA